MKNLSLPLSLKRAGTAVASRWLLWLVIAVGIALDQLTKWLAVTYLMPVHTVPLWEGVLHLTYVENRGAAFGMLSDNRAVFMVISTVMILALTVYLFCTKEKKGLFTISLSLIISGGIGNMIDRIALGYVVDFVDFTLINFAVFNFADTIVCIGAVLLASSLIRDLVRESRRKKHVPNDPADGGDRP